MTTEVITGRAHGLSGHNDGHSRHQITITDVNLIGDHLCLQYLITPAPRELVHGWQWTESPAGFATDIADRHYDCTVGYRHAYAADRIIGAVRVGPGVHRTHNKLRVFFNPFPLAPEMSTVRCAVALTISRDQAHPTSVRLTRRGYLLQGIPPTAALANPATMTDADPRRENPNEAQIPSAASHHTANRFWRRHVAGIR